MHLSRDFLTSFRDGKKLTFYYFADTYINFNSLVTDLFKVYKTRIWMSAINPASFQTPTSSLGLQPAFSAQHGHGISGAHGRDSPAGRRRQQQQQGQYGQQGQAQGQMGMGYNDYENDRFGEQANISMGMRGGYMNQYQPFPGAGMQQSAFGPPQGQDPMDPFGQYGMYAGAPGPYGMLNPAAPTFSAGGGGGHIPGSRGQAPRGGHGQNGQRDSPVNDWTTRFQGLNLGSQ